MNQSQAYALVDWTTSKIWTVGNSGGPWLASSDLISGNISSFVLISTLTASVIGGTISGSAATPIGLGSDGYIYLPWGGLFGGGLVKIDQPTLTYVTQGGANAGTPTGFIYAGGTISTVPISGSDERLLCSSLAVLDYYTVQDEVTFVYEFNSAAVQATVAGQGGIGYVLAASGVNSVLIAVDCDPATHSHSTIVTIAPTDVDPAWTECNPRGMCLDSVDGNPILSLLGQVGATTKAYLQKRDGSTGAEIWSIPLPDSVGNKTFSASVFTHQQLCVIANTGSGGRVFTINTNTGAYTTYDIPGIIVQESQCFNDVLGAIVLNMDLLGGAGSPTPLNSTPSTFSGWAVLYVTSPPVTTNQRRYLAMLGPVRDIQIGPPVPPVPPPNPTNSVGTIGIDVAVAGVGVAGSIGTIALNMDVAGVGAAGSAATGTIGIDMAVSGVSASGPLTNLTTWTIMEQGGVARTNVPIEILVPFSDAAGACPFVAGDAIQILDSDGVTIIPCQEDNRCSDVTPDIRAVKVTAILPSLGVRQTKQLMVQKVSSSSPTTGTDVTAADILATGFSCLFNAPYDNGTTYAASFATSLAASTFTNKTTAANLGKWITGGGLATQYIVYCPLKNGATAAPDNPGIWGMITAYKSQRGAVSISNPIIGIKVEWWIEMGWAGLTATSVSNHYYDLSVTCGTNTQAWVGSSPAKTLTLSGNGASGIYTATVPTATFTQDMIGMVIGDSTGQARICAYNSATSVDVWVSNPMSGTAITAGNWRIYGLNHQYAADIPLQEIWYGGSPAITAKPDIDSTLGASWNSVSLTGGPFNYFKDSKLILPYSSPASVCTNNVSILNAAGTNPTAILSSIGRVGDMYCYMPTTGPRAEIAPIPEFYVSAMIRADSNSKQKIFGNANKMPLFPINWRSQSTGLPVRLNNGTDYVVNPAFGGTLLPQVDFFTAKNRLSDCIPQVAHHPNCHYGAWLYTGSYYRVLKSIQQLFWLWTEAPSSFGTQLTKLSGNADELRGNGWTHRDMMLTLLMIPDRDPSDVLGWTKADARTWLDNHYSATNSGTANVTPYPGINIGLVNNTGVGKSYATSGPRWMSQSHLSGIIALYQLGYMTMGYSLCRLAGMCTTDGKAFHAWFAEGTIGAATDASIVPNWLIAVYWASLSDPSGTGGTTNTWPGIYRYTGHDITQYGANKRSVTGGATLSGLSGSGITVTMPTGYFTAGGSNYVGGFIRDLNAASLQVLPAVTTGGTGYAVNDTIDLTISGASTSFTVTRKAQLKVTSVSGGVITGVSINDSGLYVANSAGDYGACANTATQFATSGGGTGATFTITITDNDGNTYAALRFGMAKITAVSGDQLTMTTTGACRSAPGTGSELVQSCYPFAQTTLVSNKIQAPAPEIGDGNGPNLGLSSSALPQPFNTYSEYWEIALSSAIMDTTFGFTNAVAAKTFLTTNYTGGREIRWNVS